MLNQSYYLFSVLDVVAQEYGPVFDAINKGVALRSLAMVKAKHVEPDALSLYCLGEYNHQTGRIVAYPDPILVQAQEVKDNEVKKQQ